MYDLIKQIRSTVADSYDSARPGAGDCVRREIETDEHHEFIALAQDQTHCARYGCLALRDAPCHVVSDSGGSGETVGTSTNETIKWLQKVYSMGVSEGSVVPQQNAGEMLARLDELGFGKQEGRRGNTLWAMVLDAADEIEQLRANSQLVAQLVEAATRALRVLDGSIDPVLNAESVVKQLGDALASLTPPLINLPERAVGLKEERRIRSENKS